jgi:hypothetical protein
LAYSDFGQEGDTKFLAVMSLFSRKIFCAVSSLMQDHSGADADARKQSLKDTISSMGFQQHKDYIANSSSQNLDET